MEWQPIETAPKDGSEILIWGRYGSDQQGWMREAHMGRWNERRDQWEACWFHPYEYGCAPTHWMPLPAPPQPVE